MNQRYLIKIALIVGVIALAMIIIPGLMFYGVFKNLPLSHQVQDWSNFGSYIGGVYSALFGFFSTSIICLTLAFTITYNKQQLEQLKKQHLSNLINLYAKTLNEKLDKKTYKYFQPDVGHEDKNTENAFLRYITDRYNLNYEIEVQNQATKNPNDKRTFYPNVLKIGLSTINELNLRYDSEIGNLVEILDLINSDISATSRKELLSQFQAVTHRNRMFWMMLYAYANIPSARESIAFNEGVLIAAEGIKRSTGCKND
ncbi:hypothetical protein [Enterobacter asburiae]|uniref:hypothetical protein n=1 Tax=Enterobacter asburiae TaxID=61645 RepID=UPI0021CDFC0C|nr:hypothetical protein [Enterobacter asburiae]MCU6241679.1 hypothetical protein [Enterobacter asburiae]